MVSYLLLKFFQIFNYNIISGYNLRQCVWYIFRGVDPFFGSPRSGGGGGKRKKISNLLFRRAPKSQGRCIFGFIKLCAQSAPQNWKLCRPMFSSVFFFFFFGGGEFNGFVVPYCSAFQTYFCITYEFFKLSTLLGGGQNDMFATPIFSLGATAPPPPPIDASCISINKQRWIAEKICILY